MWIMTLALLKIKVEQALRTNGKSSPNYKRSGVTAYSSMDELVFDRGVWEGETDTYGISGVSAGSAADKTVCGSPLVTLTINNEGTDGDAVSLSFTELFLFWIITIPMIITIMVE